MTLAPPPSSGQAFPDPIPRIITFGSLNILAGASGVGKTCLLSWLLTRFRDGLPIFSAVGVNPPTALGYVCADRGFTSARYWLGKAGYADIPFYALGDDLKFDPRRLRHKLQLTQILREALDKLSLPPGSLVVVDPLALFMGGSLNDYQSCAVSCIEIRRECTLRQITMIGSAHASKQKADRKDQYQRLQDRILGSTAQLGYADTQLYLASPEETGEKFYTFLWHSHTAPSEVFPLGRDQDGLFVPWAESTQSAEEGKILAVITTDEDGTSFADILIKSEAPKTTVYRYLQEQIKEGRILKVGHGRYRKAHLN